MTVDISSLDAHEQPSHQLKSIWKAYSKTEPRDFANHQDTDDLQVPEKAAQFCTDGSISSDKIASACKSIEGETWDDRPLEDAPIYFHPMLPGMLSILTLPVLLS
jgi:hypothetical protein